MSKKIKIMLFACLGVIATAAIATVLLYPAISDDDSVVQPAYSDGAQYILRDHNGYVSVFISGGDSPHMITATLTSSLPRADRDALSVGIPIYSQAELTALLEDYCS